jgi:phospholipase C
VRGAHLTPGCGLGAPPRLDIPRMPETEQALKLAERRVMALPPPRVPTTQTLPRQEPGTRPRRA